MTRGFTLRRGYLGEAGPLPDLNAGTVDHRRSWADRGPVTSTDRESLTGGEFVRSVLAVAELLLDATDEDRLLSALLPALRRALAADVVVWAMTTRAGIEARWCPEDLAKPPPVLPTPGQLAVRFRCGPGRSVCLAVHRDGGEFGAADRELAEGLRPLLAKTWGRLAPGDSPGPLTRREAEVLELLRAGLGDQEIARRLGISPRTVGKHLEHIYAKLGEHGRLRAVARWRGRAGARDGAAS